MILKNKTLSMKRESDILQNLMVKKDSITINSFLFNQENSSSFKTDESSATYLENYANFSKKGTFISGVNQMEVLCSRDVSSSQKGMKNLFQNMVSEINDHLNVKHDLKHRNLARRKSILETRKSFAGENYFRGKSNEFSQFRNRSKTIMLCSTLKQKQSDIDEQELPKRKYSLQFPKLGNFNPDFKIRRLRYERTKTLEK